MEGPSVSEESLNGAVVTQGQLHPHSRYIPLIQRPNFPSSTAQVDPVRFTSPSWHLTGVR